MKLLQQLHLCNNDFIAITRIIKLLWQKYQAVITRPYFLWKEDEITITPELTLLTQHLLVLLAAPTENMASVVGQCGTREVDKN